MEERAKVKERNGRKGHDDGMTREMEEVESRRVFVL